MGRPIFSVRSIAELMRIWFEPIGWEVTTASSGPEGVARAAESSPDVVVLDVMLPGYDGLEALRRIRLLLPRVAVVLSTARDGDEDRLAGLAAGADAYLVKPYPCTSSSGTCALSGPSPARRLAVVSEYWDAEAATFDDEPDHGLRDPEVREAWRRLLRQHFPDPPARVADLGCGTGTLSLLLADEGFAVDGVDFSPEMVDAAREKAAGQAGVTFAVGDAGAPPFERGAYDAVLCRHVLWALDDHAAALDCWVGLLGESGRLVLVEGFWHTGAGLRATETEELLRRAGRQPTTYPLREDVYWGGPTRDERYLVVA